jgi:predicted helicase
MHPFLQLIETFDTDNHTRGVQFEKLCKWILETHPVYRPMFKTIWRWDDWPGRWGPDNGIDLIAEDMQGKLWEVKFS